MPIIAPKEYGANNTTLTSNTTKPAKIVDGHILLNHKPEIWGHRGTPGGGDVQKVSKMG